MSLSIRESDLPVLLPDQGDFVIVQHAASGALELRYRNHKQALISLPIEVLTSIPGQAQPEYLVKNPSWPDIHLQRFSSLDTLSYALCAAGRNNIAFYNSPVLLNPSLPVLPAATTTAYALPVPEQSLLLPLITPTLHEGEQAVRAASIEQRLSQVGDFLILSLPETSESLQLRFGPFRFELHHRARSNQVVITPIEMAIPGSGPTTWSFAQDPKINSDLESKHMRFFSIRKPDWPEVHNKRYVSLQQLGKALSRDVGLQLASSSLETADIPSCIPVLLLPPFPEENRVPAPLWEQSSRTVLGRWLQQFRQDASDFFALQAHSPAARPALPLLPADASVADRVQTMLDNSRGLVLGDAALSYASRRFLLEHLAPLYAQGVRTLFLGPLLDSHQALLDDFFTSGRIDNQTLEEYLVQVDDAAGLASGADRQRYGLRALLDAARAHGIRVQGLDCLGRQIMAEHAVALQHQLPIDNPLFWQSQAHTYLAQQRINAYQQQPGNDKWVALIANPRVLKTETQHGLAELTGAFGIRVQGDTTAFYPYLYMDTGNILARDWRGISAPETRHEAPRLVSFKWSRADFVLSDQLPLDLNLRLTHPKDCLLRATPGRDTLEILRRNERYALESNPITHRIGGLYKLTISPAFNPIESDLNYRQGAANLDHLCVDLFITAGLRYILEPDGLRKQMLNQARDARFAVARESKLMHLRLFATPGEHAAFKVGREQYQQQLARYHLSVDTDPQILKQFFIEPRLFQAPRPLPTETCGALLRVLQEQQRQLRQAQAQQWEIQMKALGGHSLQTMSQNLYLAEAGYQRGVCSALSAQLAAAWLLDQAASADSATRLHIERYLQLFSSASTDSSRRSARIFGLGLLAWSHNAPNEKFSQIQPVELADVSAVHEHLLAAVESSAYELSFAHHALLVGVSLNPAGTRRYVLADPNYGYCEYSSADGFLQGLQLQHQLLRLLPQAADSSSFGVRQYRVDLSGQTLFPLRLGPLTNPRSLTLADLCQDRKLARIFNGNQPLEHDHWFNKLQQHLMVAEYHDRMLKRESASEGGLFGGLLSEMMAPHLTAYRQQHSDRYLFSSLLNDHGEVSEALLAQVQLQLLVVDGPRVHLKFMSATGQYDQILDLSGAPGDLTRLEHYSGFFQQNMALQRETGRWSRLWQRIQNGFDRPLNIDTLYLTSPLPE